MNKFDINKPASKHNPFTVPEGYFDRFTDTMMFRVRSLEKSRSERDLPFVNWIPFVGVACVAILVVLFANFTHLSAIGITPTDVSDVHASHTEAYTEEDLAYDYIIMAVTDKLSNYEEE